MFKKAVLTAGLVFGVSAGAQAETLTAFDVNFSRTLSATTFIGTSGAISGLFAQVPFNPSLGTLNSVQLTLDSELIAEDGAELNFAFIRATGNESSLNTPGGPSEIFRIENSGLGDFDFSIELISTYGLVQSDFESPFGSPMFGSGRVGFGNSPLGMTGSTGSLTWQGNFSMVFDYTPAAIPLPAGVVLLLTGVGGLAAFHRRKQVA